MPALLSSLLRLLRHFPARRLCGAPRPHWSAPFFGVLLMAATVVLVPSEARAAPQVRGEQLFKSARCDVCHTLGGGPAKLGPTFVRGKNVRSPEWLKAFLANPSAFISTSVMPPFRPDNPQDLEALVAFLSELRADYAGQARAFPSSSACAGCHPRQFREWKDSFHARSLGPTFRAMFTVYTYNTGGKSPEYCLNCHAPQTKLLKNTKELAEKILAGQEVGEGINCTTCHALKEAPERPDPALESVSLDLEPIESHLADQTKPLTPFFRSVNFCGACHDYNAGSVQGPPCCTVVRGWRTSSFPHKGITCQSCHMKTAMGVTRATNEPANHRFPGPRDEEFLKKAVTMSIRPVVQGGFVEATVAVRNKAGHAIPDG